MKLLYSNKTPRSFFFNKFFINKKLKFFYKPVFSLNRNFCFRKEIYKLKKNKIKNMALLYTSLFFNINDDLFSQNTALKLPEWCVSSINKKCRYGSTAALFIMTEFLNFRFKNFNCLLRGNFFLDEYNFAIKKVNDIILSINFNRSYAFKLIDAFALLFLSKDLNYFSLYIRKLIGNLSRTEQKNFFYTFSIISNVEFRSVLRRFNIFGFFLKTTGKIGGYAGDRTKTFSMLYGMCSRSIKFYKYNYNQFFVRTKAGSIGVKILLIFKN